MSYLSPYLSGKSINETVEKIETEFPFLKEDCDTLAVRGNSGLLIGSVLASKWDKDLIIVRKDEESSHSDEQVEGWGYEQKILIVDDFIETGSTIGAIYESLMNSCDSPTILGILLYSEVFKKQTSSYTHPDDTVFKVWATS